MVDTEVHPDVGRFFLRRRKRTGRYINDPIQNLERGSSKSCKRR